MAEKTFGVDDTKGLFGDPMEWLNELPEEIKTWIFWILTGMAVVFGVVTLISLFYHGTGSQLRAMDRDVAGKKAHMTGIVSAILTMILVIMAVAFATNLWF